MERGKAKSKEAGALRRKAEKRFSDQASHRAPPKSGADVRALVHELQVHQIELEMQNEDLLNAQAVARDAADNYAELFDFAPVAYFVLDAGGVICDLNLAGAALLGLDRHRLSGHRFEQYVRPDDRAEYAAFCGRLRAGGPKSTCELTLLKKGGGFCNAILEGTVVEEGSGADGPGWRLEVMDITARKQAELALQQAHAELEKRVEERTAALQAANQQLREEIACRKVAEEALLRTAEELKRSNLDLEQFALRGLARLAGAAAGGGRLCAAAGTSASRRSWMPRRGNTSPAPPRAPTAWSS